MAYVITQSCCNDASCTEVCPVNAIHPLPEAKDFAHAEMLYIDPTTCINCAACVDVCPVSAIYPEDGLPPDLKRYAAINAEHFRTRGSAPPPLPYFLRNQEKAAPQNISTLRVAIVGTGPSGLYAAEHLLKTPHLNVEIDFIEQLLMPYGLARFGIAPDHTHTRQAITQFKWILADKRVQPYFNVKVGEHISHEELAASHHAVIYAVGAMTDRNLDIPGEALHGSHSATEFVAWYNGHPDYRNKKFNLSGKRAIVIGNGNVALDVARTLLLPLDILKKTDIADHALTALAESRIEEVVVVGRRGVMEAAYTNPELLALTYLKNIDVIIDPQDIDAGIAASPPAPSDSRRQLQLKLSREIAARKPTGNRKRIVLRYQLSPAEIIGDTALSSVRFTQNQLVMGAQSVNAEPTEKTEEMQASLLLRSVGYLGSSIKDLPFMKGRIPNTHGRVMEEAETRTGAYTVGWIKRGANGVMGTNKHCAAETVDALLQDFMKQQLATPTISAQDFANLIKSRQPEMLGKENWLMLDEHEICNGRLQGRPRVKVVDPVEAFSIASNLAH
ncbi:MAG: 4Fe-4S binding protein [Moraxellaceae bacterium]